MKNADRALDLGYAAGWAALRSVPEPVAASAFRLVADRAYARDGAGVRRLRRNLGRVLAAGNGGRPVEQSVLEDVVRRGMRSYSRYWLETFRLPSMDTVEMLSRTTTEGTAHVDDAIASGRGVILALPHSGNWEVAGVWLVARSNQFTTVAERLKPESLYDRFVAYREGLGMEVLPLTGGTVSPMRTLIQRLREGRVICLLADRDLSRHGVAVDFFGETAHMPAGPAQLAATTGAVLLPVHTHYLDHGWAQWAGAPIEVERGPASTLRERVSSATQQLADAFATRIAAHPADWHMLQPLWDADLDPSRSARRARGTAS